MKAVVAYAPGDYKYEEVETPKIENDKEIIIKVEACGICAGDIKAFEGAPSFWGDETQPAYIKAPMRSEEHTSELQSRGHLVCRLLLEKKKISLHRNRRRATDRK